MFQIKIALKFSRGLAFGFTLCIVKIVKFNVKFCAKFWLSELKFRVAFSASKLKFRPKFSPQKLEFFIELSPPGCGKFLTSSARAKFAQKTELHASTARASAALLIPQILILLLYDI